MFIVFHKPIMARMLIFSFILLLICLVSSAQQTTNSCSRNENFNMVTCSNDIQMQELIQQLYQEMQAMKAVLHTVQSQFIDGFVAFTAFPNVTSYYTYLTLNRRLIFNGVITNIGNAYDPIIGSFVCPQHGIYQFTLSMWSRAGNDAKVELMKGNEVILIVVVRANGGPTNEHSGNSVIIECHAEEDVWLRSGTSNGELQTVPTHRQNTFSGMVLRYF